jgi:hypothetical protein
MDKKVVFTINNNTSCEIEIESNLWARFFLVNYENRIPLGAESYDIFKKKLNKLIDLVTLEFLDAEIFWSITFAEIHQSIYVKRLNSFDFVFIFENEMGKVFMEENVNRATILDWRLT